ncbi:hypothetical protein [uncultured Gimesia sp.]|uniref:hypothetical protein n=1 Tax=uncultured Gimesia sp. TaxID=1678688 RepID=UPI002632C348|nr:hypothetical protein [uncultured Gimesia sp.]
MKKYVLPVVILLCVFCTLATYKMVIMSKKHTESINSALELFLKEDCSIQIHAPSTESPIRSTDSKNKDLRSLISQLKDLEYEANSYAPRDVPACGQDTIILKSLCDSKYDVWISHFGVFLIANTQEAKYSYSTGRINEGEDLHTISMNIYQSLDE